MQRIQFTISNTCHEYLQLLLPTVLNNPHMIDVSEPQQQQKHELESFSLGWEYEPLFPIIDSHHLTFLMMVCIFIPHHSKIQLCASISYICLIAFFAQSTDFRQQQANLGAFKIKSTTIIFPKNTEKRCLLPVTLGARLSISEIL